MTKNKKPLKLILLITRHAKTSGICKDLLKIVSLGHLMGARRLKIDPKMKDYFLFKTLTIFWRSGVSMFVEPIQQYENVAIWSSI